MKPTLNRTTILKLIVDGKNYSRHWKKNKINKKKIREIKKKNWEFFLFSQKCITQCFKQKCIVTMFTCKDFYE